jgi:hypothetical protein
MMMLAGLLGGVALADPPKPHRLVAQQGIPIELQRPQRAPQQQQASPPQNQAQPAQENPPPPQQTSQPQTVQPVQPQTAPQQQASPPPQGPTQKRPQNKVDVSPYATGLMLSPGGNEHGTSEPQRNQTGVIQNEGRSATPPNFPFGPTGGTMFPVGPPASGPLVNTRDAIPY